MTASMAGFKPNKAAELQRRAINEADAPIPARRWNLSSRKILRSFF
jgi:hypothetical protein